MQSNFALAWLFVLPLNLMYVCSNETFEGHDYQYFSYFHFHTNDYIVGDELFSDTYPMKLVDDCVYEVYGKVMV